MTRCQSPVLLVSDTSAQTLPLDRARAEACSNQPILSFSIVCTVNQFSTGSDSAQLPQGRTLGGTKVGTLGLLEWTIGITGSYFNTAKSKNTSHSRVWGLFQVIHSSQALLHFLISIWGQACPQQWPSFVRTPHSTRFEIEQREFTSSSPTS